MQALAATLTALQKTVNEESIARTKIMCSDEYSKLSGQIAALTEQRDSLLAQVPDSTPALAEAKKLMIAAMQAEGRMMFENVKGKFREKKEVNPNRVLTVLDGDMDLYFTISNVTQVALKEIAKTMPEKKDALMDCIEVVSRDMVDVEVVL